ELPCPRSRIFHDASVAAAAGSTPTSSSTTMHAPMRGSARRGSASRADARSGRKRPNSNLKAQSIPSERGARILLSTETERNHRFHSLRSAKHDLDRRSDRRASSTDELHSSDESPEVCHDFDQRRLERDSPRRHALDGMDAEPEPDRMGK